MAEIMVQPKLLDRCLAYPHGVARISVMPKNSRTKSNRRGPYAKSKLPPKTPEEIGHFLREYRIKKGWIIDDLADASELSIGFVSSIERGEENPSLETLQKLANALGITRGELLDVDPRKQAAVVPRPSHAASRRVK